MNRPQIFAQNKLLFGSLFFLMISVAAFFWIQNPPKITNIFSGTKPGIINVDTPDSIFIEQPFTIDIEIDTQKQSVNAVGIYLLFDPDKLQLLNLDTTQSFCQFYPVKKFDNQLGTISLACGSPHPGMSGKNTVMSLEFIPKALSSSLLITDPKSQILLNDGKGTNILVDLPQIPINVLQSL